MDNCNPSDGFLSFTTAGRGGGTEANYQTRDVKFINLIHRFQSNYFSLSGFDVPAGRSLMIDI